MTLTVHYSAMHVLKLTAKSDRREIAPEVRWRCKAELRHITLSATSSIFLGQVNCKQIMLPRDSVRVELQIRWQHWLLAIPAIEGHAPKNLFVCSLRQDSEVYKDCCGGFHKRERRINSSPSNSLASSRAACVILFAAPSLAALVILACA